MNDLLLEVQHLSLSFRPNRQTVLRVADDLSFTVRRGEIFGLVGESGAGKTTLCNSILGLCRPESGKILYNGLNIADPKIRRKHQALLCQKVQMIFQDAGASVNPRMTVGAVVAEPLCILGVPAPERERRVRALTQLVGLELDCLRAYPEALSGGQLQRVCIARALALEPEFLVADEPVASLDVSMQAQIINLLLHLQRERGLTCLFVSHDLPVVRRLCDRVGILRGGTLQDTLPFV